jgi:hypothetical protein
MTTMQFIIVIDGIDVQVIHESPWLNSEYDHFQFSDTHEPRRSIPISATGYRSQFAHHEVVERCGGPQAYAKAYAEAQRRGDTTIWIADSDETTADSPRPSQQMDLFS